MNSRGILAESTGRRLVVFTGDLTTSVRKGVVRVDRAIDGLSWLVLVHAPRRRAAQLLRSQWNNLRRNRWRWIPYQLGELWRRAFEAEHAADPRERPGREFSRAAFMSLPNVKVVYVDDIHAQDSLRLVQDFAPQLGIVLGAPILRRSLFSLPAAGSLNLHKGQLPDYRGMPPAFWELWNGESRVGCTVHWVDDKLDTGAVAATEAVACEPFSTIRGLQLQLDEVGINLVRSVVKDVLDGATLAMPQGSNGRTYRKPTLAQFATLERRLAARNPAPEPKLKAWLKSGIGVASRVAWRAGLYRALPPRITVLLYHRVTDSVRDNLSTGIEQFDRHMTLLRRHCRVLSLEEVLDAQVIPSSREPLVCVTFDDGYRDNHDNAVPILVQHQIPAAFFVSTGIVGTDKPFPHDLQRNNGALPTMDWRQLRSIKEQGFTIGSHTVNHIDCAEAPEQIVWDELVQSRDTLRRELGLQDVILGYPYGGQENMTPQRLELVRQAGYVGCLSGYGGTNLRHVDPFNVLRRAIHWRFSDQAFMRECLGLP